MVLTLTPAEARRIENLLDFFYAELQGEYPMRIHSREVEDGSQWGAPAFHPEFIRWLGVEFEKTGKDDMGRIRVPDSRTRVTRALRKVRQVSPREYYVLQLILSHKLSLNEAITRMTEREAERNREARRLHDLEPDLHPAAPDEDHVYAYDEVLTLLMAGLDKLYKWFR